LRQPAPALDEQACVLPQLLKEGAYPLKQRKQTKKSNAKKTMQTGKECLQLPVKRTYIAAKKFNPLLKTPSAAISPNVSVNKLWNTEAEENSKVGGSLTVSFNLIVDDVTSPINTKRASSFAPTQGWDPIQEDSSQLSSHTLIGSWVSRLSSKSLHSNQSFIGNC
jgi:hypothetical protein